MMTDYELWRERRMLCARGIFSLSLHVPSQLSIHLYRAPVHVDYVQEIRNINVLPRFSIEHGGRVDNINEYLDRLIKRICYELRGPSSKHIEVS